MRILRTHFSQNNWYSGLFSLLIESKVGVVDHWFCAVVYLKNSLFHWGSRIASFSSNLIVTCAMFANFFLFVAEFWIVWSYPHLFCIESWLIVASFFSNLWEISRPTVSFCLINFFSKFCGTQRFGFVDIIAVVLLFSSSFFDLTWQVWCVPFDFSHLSFQSIEFCHVFSWLFWLICLII